MAEPISFSRYAFISIGSNLPLEIGGPVASINFALAKLALHTRSTHLSSSIYVTEPVGSPPGTPDFHNAMVGLLPLENETPLSLLHKLQAIEHEAGRTRSGIKNAARTLDLDLIMFRDEVINTEELTLPHPRAHERRFVLEPFIEIVGSDFQLPDAKERLGNMLSKLKDGQAIRKL